MSANADALRQRFFDRLAAQRPESVLDVGCGAGFLLRACRKKRIPATGLEGTADAVLELRSQGFEITLGTAERLPFEDGEFDWVTMRHVPHHLLDPKTAIHEAARVARTGVALAEPWRDSSLPEQVLGRRYDPWIKRQDRRLGHIHNEDIAPLDLAAMLPDRDGWQLECEYVQRMELADPVAIRSALDARIEGVPDGGPEREEYEALVESAALIGENGTAILVARKRT